MLMQGRDYTIICAFATAGKLCTTEGQNLIDEEEDLDGSSAADDREDRGSSQSWLRGSQVAPEAGK